MPQSDINKMDFKELRNEVQRLRDELARIKRSYEDLFYNLDEDNFSVIFRKKAKNMESSIEQTAESIKMTVSKTLNFGEAVLGKVDPSDSSSKAVAENLYFWESEDKKKQGYYYYNNLSEQWEKVSQESVYSAFIQTETGFEFNGSVVKINGDLITEGTITGTDIVRDGTNGKITLKSDGVTIIDKNDVRRARLNSDGLIFADLYEISRVSLSDEGMLFGDSGGNLNGWAMETGESGGTLGYYKNGTKYFTFGDGNEDDDNGSLAIQSAGSTLLGSFVIDLDNNAHGRIEFKGLSGGGISPCVFANGAILATQEWVKEYISGLTISL